MVREVVLSDDIPPGFGEQVARSAADALSRLDQGLAGYGAATERT
jgi:hypothetical protein